MLILLAALLSACKKDDKDILNDRKEVNVYYFDTKTSSIVSEPYVPQGETKAELVDELLNKLKQVPENVIYKSALPESVTVKEAYFNLDGRLTINFDSNYSSLTGIPEVLCRAAIVKTLCQIPGVELIEFNVNGQPLKDSNDVVVGFLTAKDFIDNIEDEMSYKVNLYFANEQGDALIQVTSDVYYNGTGTIEELVIKQLINGPTELGVYDTIPEGTTLLNVSTNEGICTVDFNEKFLEKLPNITDEVAIYSVVNTLVELNNVNKVQFKINGQVQKTYREGIPFDKYFERNLTLIDNDM